jgi:hypothetical protein
MTMSRLADSPEVLAAIKRKATHNALMMDTYGKKAEFVPGRVVLDFDHECRVIQKRRLRYL